MKIGIRRAAAVSALVAVGVLGGASAAAATPPVLPGGVIPAPAQFGGTGTGPTDQDALDAAVADALSRAAAAGFTDCDIIGDPIVLGGVRPGFPVTYRALVALGCTG